MEMIQLYHTLRRRESRGRMDERRTRQVQQAMAPPVETRRDRLVGYFGLERNIVAVSATMFLLALGENLWRRFLPRYLQALGAPITAIGLFGTVEDFLDGVYQYPGGWLADTYGRRRALVSFIALGALGYTVFLFMHSWWIAFIGLALIMA